MFNSSGEYKRMMPEKNSDSTRFVVLVHGIFMWGVQFEAMARKFHKLGYAAFLYDYPTRLKSIQEHGCDFKDYLSALMAEFPSAKINLVTHSMGGLISRAALPLLDENERARLGRMVMLAPPNKGSHVAEYVMKHAPALADLYKPVRDLDSSGESPIHAIPEVSAMPFAVIAAEYDALVADPLTHLANESCHATLGKHIHSSVMFGDKAFLLTEEFIRTGKMG